MQRDGDRKGACGALLNHVGVELMLPKEATIGSLTCIDCESLIAAVAWVQADVARATASRAGKGLSLWVVI